MRWVCGNQVCGNVWSALYAYCHPRASDTSMCSLTDPSTPQPDLTLLVPELGPACDKNKNKQSNHRSGLKSYWLSYFSY